MVTSDNELENYHLDNETFKQNTTQTALLVKHAFISICFMTFALRQNLSFQTKRKRLKGIKLIFGQFNL